MKELESIEPVFHIDYEASPDDFKNAIIQMKTAQQEYFESGGKGGIAVEQDGRD